MSPLSLCLCSAIGPPWTGTGFRALWRTDGATYVDTKRTSVNLGPYGIKDVLGMAYDDSTKQVQFYKNGKYVGKLTTNGNGQQYFGAASDSSGKGAKYRFNFGAKSFKYEPPKGYKGLTCGVRGYRGGDGKVGGSVDHCCLVPVSCVVYTYMLTHAAQILQRRLQIRSTEVDGRGQPVHQAS